MYEILAVAHMTKIAQTPDNTRYTERDTGPYVYWDDDTKKYYNEGNLPRGKNINSLRRVSMKDLSRDDRAKAQNTLSYAPSKVTFPEANYASAYIRPNAGRQIKLNYDPEKHGPKEAFEERLHRANMLASSAKFMLNNKHKFKDFDAKRYQDMIDRASALNRSSYTDHGVGAQAQEYYNKIVPTSKINLDTSVGGKVRNWGEWQPSKGGASGHADPQKVFKSVSNHYEIPSYTTAVKDGVKPSKSNLDDYEPMWRFYGLNAPKAKKPEVKNIGGLDKDIKSKINIQKNWDIGKDKTKNMTMDLDAPIKFKTDGIEFKGTGTM